MFGINAPESDRVNFRMRVTCSPVHIKDLAKDATDEETGDDLLQFFIGPIPGVTEYTYQYNMHTIRDAVGYYLT
jgi:hypothetical protein